MLKKLRVVTAVLFWLCITILFCDLTGATRAWLGWMAKLQFLPAIMAVNVGVVVLWVVVTLLVGRIYCSVICPLGVLQDGFIHLADSLVRRTSKNKTGRYHFWVPTWSKVLRALFFVLFLVALLMGSGAIVQWLAPYSSYGRMVTALVRPLVWQVNQWLADWAAANESYAFWHVTWAGLDLSLVITAFVSIVILMVTSFFGGRFYCNNICPVGAVLGVLARRSLLRVHIDSEKCVKCGLCERKCKAMAIDSKRAFVDTMRCVDCFNCLDACHKDALHFGLVSNPSTKLKDTVAPVAEPPCPSAPSKEPPCPSAPSKDSQVDTSRRTFLATAVAVTAAAKLKADEKFVDGVLGEIADKKRYERQTVICPPGSGSLKNLQQHCTGCQLCVTACPNGVLSPSTGLLHYLQPTMSYENGHCRPECHACSDVCPAGAIKPLGTTHEEKMARKASLKIGRAVWIKDNCIPLSDGNRCGNCARHCPTGAITMIPSDPNNPKSIQIPSVDEERCIGCGACEHLCPSRPFSAIYVEGIEVQREI